MNTLGCRLMVACLNNQIDSVRLLRKYGADFYLADNGGSTAIHWATDARSVKLIDFLAESGADLNVQDSSQARWTPLIRCG